jgi:hypothetical protein
VTLVATILVLLAPVALIYGWVCYFTPASQEPTGWRSGATFLSLALVSLVVLLWLEMMVRMPGADWRNGAEVAHQVQWVGVRLGAAFDGLTAAFILGCVGRPRLIAHVTLACVGTAILWVGSTAM